jgi:hypothetical protein
MQITLTQIEKQHDANKLHDALTDAGLTVRVEGKPDGSESYFTFADEDEAAVQAVIDAYVYVDPGPPQGAWYAVPTADVAIGYNEYTALLNQSGTGAPVATVMKNSIGAIVWTRTAPGNYIGTLLGAFPSGKTALLPMAVDLVTNLTAQFITRQDDNQIEIVTADISSFPTPVTADSILVDALVNVRVYLL